MTRQINLIVAGTLAVFGLCACDDETTAASESPAMSVLESGKKLGNCSKDNAGEMVYVSDSATVFYCADGIWQTLNGKDGAAGKDGIDGKNGSDGKDGENGADGQGGSSGRDTVVVNQKDTIVVNHKDTVVVRDTVVVINRDTVVVKESGGSESSGSGMSLTGKPNWVYLNPAIDYGEITDERDGQVYKTVKIGDQVWMAENLNFEYKVADENTGVEKTIGNYCNEDDCLKFGRYYTWSTAMDSVGVYSENGMGCGYGLTCTPVYPVRGICPKGWHLPDTSEWSSLYKSVNSKNGALQSVSFEANWTLASNTSGFSALPTGSYSSLDGKFHSVGSAYFWSSIEDHSLSDRADYWYLGSDNSYLGYDKYNGNSIRCVQDSE